MITNGKKPSILVQSQLPAFIGEDPQYANFVAFLQAYYEWMEQDGNVVDATKNLLSYKDVDTTTSQFMQYFINDFIPYFPQGSLINEATAIKAAKQLYGAKGTPAAYEFLFRILYNSSFSVFYTKDSVLKASAGDWYVAKSLRLIPVDSNLNQFQEFINANNLRVFGETTKSIATIENAFYNNKKVEVFISNIERLFQSGEDVRVVDANNQDVLINGLPIRGKIVGQISQIKIDPNNRGQLYQTGDPVIVYNGLNNANGHGAFAQVGNTTTGSIQNIKVIPDARGHVGGYGYTLSPNTTINITNAPGAFAIVGSIDPSQANTANVTFYITDSIDPHKNIRLNASDFHFANLANVTINTTLANAFTHTTLATYPISSVLVLNGGGGISKIPSVSAVTAISDDIGSPANLAGLGILAPIQISNGGLGYRANDKINFSGGSGYGAYANVATVNSNGTITAVSFVYGKSLFPLGGMGYRPEALPSLSVSSANTQASGASLFAPGVLATGAEFQVITDRTGSVTSINILDQGEDYIAAPNVSLRIQDIVVSNVSLSNLPKLGDKVYQGSNVLISNYISTVNSISLLAGDANPLNSLYNLRVFNYTTTNINNGQTLNILNKNINMKLANVNYQGNYNKYGIRTYGDGNAKANASFLNGLVLSSGQYLSTSGQLSSYDVLQSTDYNNYTYEITVQKEFIKYKEILLNLLHPTGLKVIGRYSLSNENNIYTKESSSLIQGEPLYQYTGTYNTMVSMVTDFTNFSNNIISFTNLSGANLAGFIFTGPSYVSNTILEITPTNGPVIKAEVIKVNTVANTVTLRGNTILTFANVANVLVNSGSNTINIQSMTGSYDIINNGNYNNPLVPLEDVVFVGDKVSVLPNSPATVTAIDYINGIITVNSNFSYDVNGFMSVARTVLTNKVNVYGLIGTSYEPQLADEYGEGLITEDGNAILLG